MEQSRVTAHAKQQRALASGVASPMRGGVRAATVAVLSGRISSRLADPPDDALVEAKHLALNVRGIGHDPRPSPEGPELNQVMAGLDPASHARLRPELEWVSLPVGRALCEAGDEPSHVYFPTSGIVSLSHELKNGTAVEVALTGNEGLVGVQVLMGGGRATSRAVVRATGFGYRLRADTLQAHLEACAPLRRLLLRHAQALMTQVAQAAVCHCHHQVEQQFSRLLLVSLDRMPSNELALTHDTMAGLLGARRESISASAATLQAAGVIRYHRGHITLLDRRALEARACECYGVVRAELDRLIARPGCERKSMPTISRRYAHAHAGLAV